MTMQLSFTRTRISFKEYKKSTGTRMQTNQEKRIHINQQILGNGTQFSESIAIEAEIEA